MKKIEISQYGDPERFASCVEAEDVGSPGADEVVFEVIAFPINPADVSFCWGRYRLKPDLPATPGAECVGRVIAIGSAVSNVLVGDLVINLDRENWAQKRRVRADRVIVLPDDVDIVQAAMLRINPPTAMLLLSDIVRLERGDWLVQNVANSAVGKLIIAIAKEAGLRTINVLRRPEVFESLRELGADICVEDGPDLADTLRERTGGATVKLGVDAVAGEATSRIAACVSDGGTVCTYGSMSGQPIQISPSDLVYRGLSFQGFLLGRFLERRTSEEIKDIYRSVVAKVSAGSLRIPVERIYPIEEIRAALAHVGRSRDGGKILVAPNGLSSLLRDPS